MLAATLLFLSIVGISFVALILRADARRFDNRMLAAIILVDAGMALARFVGLVSGLSLEQATLHRGMHIGSIALAHLSIEFAYSFPRSRPMPWRARAGLLAVAGAALLWCAFGSGKLVGPVATYGYFVPAFLVMMTLLWRNLRRAEGDDAGIRLVMAAFALRWAAATAAFAVGIPLGHDVFIVLLIVESIVAPLVAFLMIGSAVLRSQLFSIRGAAAEVMLYVFGAVGVVGLTAVAVEAALHFGAGGPALRAMLVAAALVPAAALAIGGRVRARVEDALCNWDPRRALRREVLSRVATHDAPDPDAIWLRVRDALDEVTLGGKARFLIGADIPAELASERHLLRRGELLVPVRAGRHLFGAIAVAGGTIDRDTLLAAVSLADHLALRLENHALFAELEESRRLATLGAFAAAIAHDLRTPLTSVQMNVQILRGKAQAAGLAPDDMEYFDITLGELRRVNGHIAELLDYAKPVQLRAIPVDVREVVDDAARGLSTILGERRLEISRDHEAGLPRVLGDAQRIRQVLENLVDNAAKASPEGGAILLRTRRTDDHRVAVEVTDRGRGIEADLLVRIFEPFFTTRPDGTGLGLAICQKLVKAHSGEIQVRSTPGEGSTFTVFLPAAS